VVRDVLTQEDCDQTLEDIYSILEADGKFERNNPDTWHNWPADAIPRYGNMSKPPIFLPQFMRNRQNPNVHKVFSLLLKEEDLITNHDRACLFRPTMGVQFATGMRDPKEWATADNVHIDMNPWHWMGDGKVNRDHLRKLRYDRPGNFIYENNQPSHADGLQLQAVLNMVDNYAEDGGYVCIPGFKYVFEEYFNACRPNGNIDEIASYNFKEKDPVMKYAKRVSMRPGSMVIWDQRMAHGSFRNRSSRMRCAQFIKMYPRKAIENPERANARALVLIHQVSLLKAAGFEPSKLGEKLFGLDMVTDAKDPPSSSNNNRSTFANIVTGNNNQNNANNNATNNNNNGKVPFKPRKPKNAKK
jgi:hypothetical protein